MTLRSLSIIGGSRWARQIALTLDSLLSAETKITLHSQHNTKNIQGWINDNNLNRINVVNTYPFCSDSIKPTALLVVNQSRKHFPIAIQSLSCGIPTFVEKPISLTEYDAKRLLETAVRFKAPLYASNVFMFAKYFEDFFCEVRCAGEIQEVDIVWTDKCEEFRYGEVKKYDPSVTVLHDVMPHIVSIIKMLSLEKLELNSLDVFRGGAEVVLQLMSSKVKFNVKMARNADSRARKVRVRNAMGIFELDFSNESNMFITNIQVGSVKNIPAPSIGALQNMMASFIDIEKESNFDSRLSPEISLEACHLCDIGITQYRKLQIEWLMSQKEAICKSDISYAFAEMTCS
ncbi:MAG: hypothetical protein ACI9IA_000011 [Enterobacterales bacterium]|jgi:hypothetical protein